MNNRKQATAMLQLREYELLSTAIQVLNTACEAQFQNTIDHSVRRSLCNERDRLTQRLADLHRDLLGDLS